MSLYIYSDAFITLCTHCTWLYVCMLCLVLSGLREQTQKNPQSIHRFFLFKGTLVSRNSSLFEYMLCSLDTPIDSDCIISAIKSFL